MVSSSDLFRQEVIEERKNRLHGEVVLKQTVSSKMMVAALIAVILIAVIWVVFGQYARTEQARGILVTTQPSAKIVATRAGVITDLRVTEGSKVEKGDVIAVINLDRKGDDGVAGAATILGTLDSRKSLARQQIDIMRNRAAAEKRRLNGLIAVTSQQINDLDAQLEFQRDIVKSNQTLFDKIEEVVEKGFVSQVDYERRRQNLLNSQQALSRLEQQRISLQGDINRARSEIAQGALSVSQEISNMNSSIETLTQQQAQTQGEKAYIVTAPISGRVAALQSASGRLANPNQPMMTIVPDGSTLQAQIYAPTRAIGFVKPSQEVRLLYDAFPYQRFGSYNGKISDISRIIIDPRETDIPFQIEEPVYRVTVSIEQQEINGYGEAVPLQPGMTLTANLILERQSFLDWILTPVRAVLNRS